MRLHQLIANRRVAVLAAAVAVAATLAQPGQAAPVGGAGAMRSGSGASVDVSLRVTAHGIPHLLAHDWRSMGYGLGWSEAHDVLCPLAEAFVTADAQRSRYFGPSGSYDESYLNGTVPNNLESDFFYKRIIDQHTVEHLIDAPGVAHPLPAVRQSVAGFAAGYNAALAAQDAPAGISDPACRGAAWVHPITSLEVWRRLYGLTLLASSNYAMHGIVAAAPPAAGAPRPAVSPSALLRSLSPDALNLAIEGVGSNAIALGKDATRDRHGLLLGNPHVPWYGSERFYEFQQTIPGKVDAAGVGFLGVPAILNGFNRDVAWTNTDWTAREFVPFQLQLAPGKPTSYVVDGTVHDMTPTTVTVDVRNTDGSISQATHTFYDTIYGPVLTEIAGLPVFPWTTSTAYAMFDANAANLGRAANQFFAYAKAQSVTQLNAIAGRYQGLPWAQTIAADSHGRTLFTDVGSIPNFDTDRYTPCLVPLGVLGDRQYRLPVMDGTRSGCAPGRARGAAADGILAPRREPSLIRSDYVENSNDSYWLVNAHHPMTGFSRIIGDVNTPRLFRTRQGIKAIEDRLAGKSGRARLFTPAMLRRLMFDNTDYEAQLWQADALAMCRDHPTMLGSNGPVDVSGACAALAAYHGHADIGSRGYLLWRRFSERIWFNGQSSNPWADAFDPKNPVNTPAKLNTSDRGVQQAFADAVTDLRAAGIPLDAPLGDFAYVTRNGERIPIHGGPPVGIFNAIYEPFVAGRGYPDVVGGSSFVDVVRVTGRCPDARTLLTYSQSTDPTSPYYADQTRMYSRKQWVTFPFCADQIRHAPGLRVVHLRG